MGLDDVRIIFLSKSGSLPMFIALADPEHSATPTVRRTNSETLTVLGDIAYEHIELKVTSTVRFGFVSFR